MIEYEEKIIEMLCSEGSSNVKLAFSILLGEEDIVDSVFDSLVNKIVSDSEFSAQYSHPIKYMGLLHYQFVRSFISSDDRISLLFFGSLLDLDRTLKISYKIKATSDEVFEYSFDVALIFWGRDDMSITKHASIKDALNIFLYGE